MDIRFLRKYLPKRYALAISRGVSKGSENLFVTVSANGVEGVGELSGTNTPGGETCHTGIEELTSFWETGVEGLSIYDIWDRARAHGVRPRALAALDVALWDRFARECKQPLWRLFGLPRRSVPTSITVGINPPDVIREQVPEMLDRTGCPYLKVKLGSREGLDADIESFHTVLECVSSLDVSIRVDANGGWTLDQAQRMLRLLAEHGVDYVEQPLPQGAEDQLPELFRKRPLPIFVDESCHWASDVPAVADRVDGVNLKLMKCGGLTEALRLVAAARAHGLGTMIGCMGESSVAISAGACLGALFDYVDLDSHLNLNPDPAVGAELIDGTVLATERPGHGARLIHAEP